MGDGHLMKVELAFNRNQLTLNAEEVRDRILNRLSSLKFPLIFEIESVTVMSKWLVVLVDYPLKTELIFDAIAGEIVIELMDYGVRYRHFTVHGEGSSLIFKEKNQS